MRPPRLLAALSLAVAGLARPAAAADLPAPSRIDAVTVYRGAARVTRVARLELPAGESRVLLEGLPAGLDDDSVRVEGKGTARAQVLGVTAAPFTRAEAARPEVREAEQRVEALEDEDRALDDRAARAKARARFAESLRASYSDERARNLAVRAVSTREWAELLAFVDRELAAAAAEERQAGAHKRELARRLAAARAGLEQVAARGGQRGKVVAVELTAERAGTLELSVSYLVGGAGWEPVWDARLRPEAGKVDLTLLGTVTQRTGEDWTEARLALSTAQPGRGLWVPVLEPRWLERLQPMPAMAPAAAAAPAPRPGKAKRAAPRPEAGYDALKEEAFFEELRAPEAQASMGLLAATFAAPQRATVDGAGRARTVTLARYELAAEVTRTAAPRVDAAAYLVAKVQNETGVPFLPGMARVSLGDEFVGRAPLAETPPGGRLELAFGADPRIEVERRVLERRQETSGLLSRDDVIRYRVRTTVKNRYGAATAVRLLDLVPVSRDEKITVKLLDGTTPATREDPDRPGVRVTELLLQPREERAVELGYEVRHAQGVQVSGLE